MHALAQVAERVRAAAAEGTRLRIRGQGTKDFLSGARGGEVLDVCAHAGIVDYEPSELFATVRAGTPLSEFEAVLAGQGQCLPFEPPRLPRADGQPGGTVGGIVAAGLAGPGRAAVGSVRDFVLGAVVVDGRGELLHFGGQVMKNVAGYDVSRVMAGSWGALGLLCEVSLKVLPTPPGSLTLRFELGQDEALRHVRAWSARPLPIHATAWWRGRLALRLRGARAAVESAARHLGGEPMGETEAAVFWDGLRDQRGGFFDEAGRAIESGGRAVWRLSVPAASPVIAHGDDALVEWGGAQRWVVAAPDDEALAAQAALAGGSAQRMRGGPAGGGMHTPVAPPPALRAVQHRLRAAFDPHGVFVPGRPVDF